MLVGLAAAVLAGAVAVGVVMLTRDDDSSRATDAAGQGTDSSPSSAPETTTEESTAEGTPSLEAGPTATATPQPSAEGTASVAPYACWDAAPAASLSECSQPEGRAGLEYVFPSMAGQDCRRINDFDAAGRLLLFQCFGTLADGTSIRINYSQWDAVGSAVEHYDGKGLTRSEGAGVIGWSEESDGPDGLRNAAFGFDEEPFTASWYAPTPGQLTEALNSGVVSGRSVDEVRGEPVA